MKHASLFSGIGGFDLAAKWMGWENVFQVEWDKYCQKVLEKNFPKVKRYGDITKFNGKPYEGTIDIITGGFPCQPFSAAGKRKGTEDDRHLWPEMLRIIREIKPSYAVGENVGGLLTWNDGMVLEQVFLDLENEGYEVGAFIIPACAVNAPHRRDRIWFVAYSDKCAKGSSRKGEGASGKRGKDNDKQSKWRVEAKQHNRLRNVHRVASNSKGKSWNECKDGSYREMPRQRVWRIQLRGQDLHWFKEFWDSSEKSNLESPVCRTDDGIPNRVDRIEGLGNAIVPQVVYQIFKTLKQL